MIDFKELIGCRIEFDYMNMGVTSRRSGFVRTMPRNGVVAIYDKDDKPCFFDVANISHVSAYKKPKYMNSHELAVLGETIAEETGCDFRSISICEGNNIYVRMYDPDHDRYRSVVLSNDEYDVTPEGYI